MRQNLPHAHPSFLCFPRGFGTCCSHVHPKPADATSVRFWPDRLRESGWLQVTKKVLASHEGWVLLEEEEDDDDE